MAEIKYQKLEKGDFPSSDEDGVPVRMVEKKSGSAYRPLVLATLCMITVTLLATLYYMRYVCPLPKADYTSSMEGAGGRKQTILASVEGNFVEYYIEDLANSEKSWIIDDFNMNVEIMRSDVDDYSICYVLELNHTEAVKPSEVAIENIGAAKRHYHAVLTPDTVHIDDKSVLGARGAALCGDVNVYWLRPMSDVIDVTHTNTSLNTNSLVSSRRHKRNIKECQSSCCWLVCCCDVHHFNWETVERFSCKHVCDKCTSAYKSKIQKIC